MNLTKLAEELIPFMLFGTIWWFLLVFAIIFIGIMISLEEEVPSVALSFFVLFVFLDAFWGNMHLYTYFTFVNIVIYLSLAFVYAIIRTFLKGKSLVVDGDELKTKEKKEWYIARELKHDVFGWITMFPFSLLLWIVGDMTKQVYNYLYKKVAFLFEKLIQL